MFSVVNVVVDASRHATRLHIFLLMESVLSDCMHALCIVCTLAKIGDRSVKEVLEITRSVDFVDRSVSIS